MDKQFTKIAMAAAVSTTFMFVASTASAATNIIPSSASASTTSGSYVANNARDNNVSTRWEATNSTSSITFTLPSCQKIDEFVIDWYGSNTYSYQYQLSSDGGATWSSAVSTSGSGTHIKNITDVSANAIKLTGSGSTLRINELYAVSLGAGTCSGSATPTTAPTATPTALPTATPTTAPTAAPTATPTSVSGITYPGQLINLSRWHLTLPTSKDSTQYPADQVNYGGGGSISTDLQVYTGTYFKLNAAKDAIVMTSLFGGATTSSGTAYARSELRERTSTYASAAWVCKSDKRWQKFVVKVAKAPINKPEMSMGQIHDGDSDNVEVKYLAPGTIQAYFNGGAQKLNLDTAYNIGEKMEIGIYANQKADGTADTGYMTVTYKNLSTNVTSTQRVAFGTVVGSCYFKVGNYHQACTKTNIYGGTNQTCVNKGWTADKYETDPWGTSALELYSSSMN